MRRLAVFLSLCVCAVAQSDRSIITGTITDPAGAVVANAPVQARNLDTGGQYEAASTATGNYALNELPVGHYELSVAVPGFKKFVRGGLEVQTRQTYRIDIALEVGAASESVTVTEATPLLKTESGELAHSVTSNSLNQLPVLGIGAAFASNSGIRNPMAVTQLIPGGIYVGDNVVRLNGAPSNTQNLRIEGQDSTNTTWVNAVSQNQPSVDSIQEFAVQTSNYAAEFGKAGGGVFIVTMKSGSNQFHGSAYDYFVNEALNASTPFVNAKPVARRNDYGFTGGGPVWIPKIYDGHDKTFFFYNFEQFRENQVINNVPQTVPTAAYRLGDFSTALTGRALTGALATDALGRAVREGMIYDPNTQRIAPNGAVIRDPFTNNRIPLDRFDPVSVRIQNLIPLPLGSNASSLFQNYLPSYIASRKTDINSLKMDQNISSKSKFSFFWSRTHTNSPVSPVLGSDGFPDPITAARGNYTWVHQFRMNYDYTIAPTLLLHIGAGYVDQNGPRSFTLPRDSFDPDSIGLKGVFKTGRFPQFTGLNSTVNTGGMSNMGQATVGGSPENPAIGIKSWRPGGNVSLTWIKNNHTFKTGGEVLIGNFAYPSQASAAGRFAFSANQTSLPSLIGQNTGGAVVGFPYASFLLGQVDSGTIGYPTTQHLNEEAYALFVQDTWKVTRKFTLDYGLRWDFQTYLREQYGRMPGFGPNTLNPTVGRLGATVFDGFLPGRCQCDFARNYPYAVGPRLGAAYQINPKTVVRAGFGIVYAKTAAYDNLTITGGDSPFSSPGLYQAAMILNNGTPTPKPWPNFDPGQYPNIANQIGTAQPLIDPNAGRPARQLQWSFSVQREIMRDLAVEASYLGNRGAWWRSESLMTYNAIQPDQLRAVGLDINNANDRAVLTSPINSAAAAARGLNRLPYASFPTTQTLAQALRPYPQFGNINPFWSPLGSTWYNSLQVKVTKRLSHGLDGFYSFTWQKSLTAGAENESAVITGGVAANTNDVFNRANNKYISGYNQPLVSQLGLNYTLPKWGGNKVVSWVARDWTIGAFLSYRSGMPIRVPASNNALASLLFQNTYANRVPGQPLFTQDLNCHCFDPARTFVLNPAAWSDPAPGQWGTSAAYYDDYRYQRRPSESLNAGRLFQITERVTFHIRAEFTNVFNRTAPNNPTATNFAQTQGRNQAMGITTSGFGFINTGGTFSLPRQGVIVGRFQF